MYRRWRRRKKPKPGIHGGLWDIRTHSCPTAQRFVSDPPAVPRLRRTARRSFSSRCAIKTVSRPAGSLKFNLRGRRYAVPANGCLVTLMRWPNLQRIQFGKSAQTVDPATVASPEILPISPRRCVFSLDKSLSWVSYAIRPNWPNPPTANDQKPGIFSYPALLTYLMAAHLSRTISFRKV